MTSVLQPQNTIDFNLGSYDLFSYESVTRLIENLKKMESAFNCVNSKFKSELDGQKQKLQKIVERLLLCRKKIEVLEKLNVAIAFVSPAKFVKKYKYQEDLQNQIFYDQRVQLNSIISERRGPAMMFHQPETLGKLPEGQNSLQMKPDELKNTLAMNYGKFKPRRKHLFEGDNAITKRVDFGLGQIPSNLRYVEGLLIYNTQTNPYTHYSKIDPLATNQQSYKKNKPEEKKDKKGKMADAPLSIQQSQKMETYQQSQYTYKPTLKQGPVLNFEENLDIDNIVDLQVGSNTMKSFAPSQEGVLKQNKVIEDPYKNAPIRQQQQQVQQTPLQQLQQPQQQPVQQMQQLQAPQQQLYQQQQQVGGLQPPTQQIPQNINVQPTMNQLQPPVTMQGMQQPVAQTQLQVVVEAPAQKSGGNAISALLDSIRNFKKGGNLKAIKTKERGQKVGRSEDAVDPDETAENKSMVQKKPLTMLDQLKQKISNRFVSLNPPPTQAKTAKNATIVKKKNQGSDDEEIQEEEEEK